MLIHNKIRGGRRLKMNFEQILNMNKNWIGTKISNMKKIRFEFFESEQKIEFEFFWNVNKNSESKKNLM
jgi:hypothetical protein